MSNAVVLRSLGVSCRSFLVAVAGSLLASSCFLEIPDPPANGDDGCSRCTGAESCSGSVWLSPAEVRALPIAGDAACDARCTLAWQELSAAANAPSFPAPDLAAVNDDASPYVLAKALLAARLDDAALRGQVKSAIEAAIPTTPAAPGDSFPVSSHIGVYVIAADLIELSTFDPAFHAGTFVPWLDEIRTRQFSDDRTLLETAQERPSHAGTYAMASLAAIAVYLGDDALLNVIESVLRGWLGDRSQAAQFQFRADATSWMADPAAPVAVNPVGAVIDGHGVDGVLVDSIAETTPFVWPPPYSDNVYNALGGAIVAAVILERQGRDPWPWSDAALRRAAEWMLKADDGKTGWDTSNDPTKAYVLDLIDWAYGTSYARSEVSEPGRNMAWTSWSHAACP
jgi:hypothetical protein